VLREGRPCFENPGQFAVSRLRKQSGKRLISVTGSIGLKRFRACILPAVNRFAPGSSPGRGACRGESPSSNPAPARLRRNAA